MAIGIALVAASVLLGARLLGAADDTVAVYAARQDLLAGTDLTAQDLLRNDVRFTDAADADRYVSAESAIPDGSTVGRDVGAGELLPRAALGEAGADSLVEVPIAAAADAIPSTVGVGSTVDVWVTPESAEGRPSGDSVLVFDDVTVVAAPKSGSALGPTATRQLIIGVPGDSEDDLAKVLGQTFSGQILVTRQG